MPSPPKIFISAVSGDLGGVRQIVKDALLTIDCHPVEQTTFAPDWRAVGDMLRGRIGDCQALIHIAGMRYGAEPDPATLPPGAARRSYTQMEYDIGRALQRERGDHGFRVYTFVCPPDFPYDRLGKDGAPLPVEHVDLIEMQEQHRAALLADPHLYEQPADSATIQTRVTALREEVLTLRIEQAEVKREVQTTRRFGAWAVAAILLVLAGILYWQMQAKRDTHALLEQFIKAQGGAASLSIGQVGESGYERALRTVADENKIGVDEARKRLTAAATAVQQDPAATLFDQAKAAFALKDFAKTYTLATQAAEKQSADLADKWTLAGQAAVEQVKYREAVAAFEKALALRDEAKDPVEWANSANWLGIGHYRLAAYAKAEPLYRRALETWESTLGPEHPATLIILSNLGALLYAKGDLAGAEPLCRRALETRERKLGPEHPDTLGSLNNLDALLYAKGDLAGAEPLFRRALETQERKLGPEHPDTLGSLNNLGSLLHAKGDLAGAEPLYRRALETQERTLGPEYPDTLMSLHNLGALLYDKGDLAGAEPLIRRALETRERTLGLEHPDTLGSLNGLGALLYAKGDLAGAEESVRRALAGYEKVLPPEHPWRKTVERALAKIIAKRRAAGK